jgi:Zinc-finger double-stranded RNA-binding
VTQISAIAPSGKEVDTTYRIPKKPTLKLPRAVAAERPSRSIKKIRRKQDKALSDKVFRQQNKPKHIAKKNRYCKTCDISCNSAKTFYDHIQSKGHKNRRATEKVQPSCFACSRDFESHHHLSRHLNSKNHLKVISKNH